MSIAERYLRRILNEVSGSPYDPTICDLDDVLFQKSVVWVQRSLAILSSITALCFTVGTAYLLNKNDEMKDIREKKKASSVYFLQIMLSSVLLCIVILGAVIAVIVNEFENQRTSSFVTIGLPVVVSLLRNLIYITTSKKLRSHIQELLFSLRRACKKQKNPFVSSESSH